MLKKVFIDIIVLSVVAFSQTESFTFPRDTTYTLNSAFNKYKKDYPFITPVHYDTSGSLKQSIFYNTGSENRPLTLDIFSTPGNAQLKPAVLLIHGGGWNSGDKSLMHPLADYLAHKGYIGVAVEYRLSPEARYPAAVNDIKMAVSWVLKNGSDYHIDTNKIAILGCSAGAQLAGLVGLTYDMEDNSSHIKAIINIDGIMDFTSEEARKHEDNPQQKVTAAGRWFGGQYADKPELWTEASPVYYVDKNSPPMLFINSSMPRFHVGRDEVIEQLDQFSIKSHIHTFDDAPHSFWLFEPWFDKTGMLIVDFLNKVLAF